MSNTLMNVRLDAERVRKVQLLRERGVSLSDLVRDAIDQRFDALRLAGYARDGGAIVARLLEQYPDPPDLPARDYDVHDRRAARAAVAGRLRRRASSRPRPVT
jgi:hypothetical protein